MFCLTEVGHGLDVIHMETTATLLENGEFDLHTPLERAAKYICDCLIGVPFDLILGTRYMPPTAPVGIPCIAIVFARAIIRGEDCGIKPFVVDINDGYRMAPGVTCKYVVWRILWAAISPSHQTPSTARRSSSIQPFSDVLQPRPPSILGTSWHCR